MTMDAHTGSREISQFLTFYLREDEFALEILDVREVIQYSHATPVPRAAEWIHGVINLRGRIVPVVDLAMKLGLGKTRVAARTCIVVVDLAQPGDHDERLVLGALVDGVHQVLELSPEEIQSAPSFGTRVASELLSGVARTQAGLTLLLRVSAVLANEEWCEASEVKEEDPLDIAAISAAPEVAGEVAIQST